MHPQTIITFQTMRQYNDLIVTIKKHAADNSILLIYIQILFLIIKTRGDSHLNSLQTNINRYRLEVHDFKKGLRISPRQTKRTFKKKTQTYI